MFTIDLLKGEGVPIRSRPEDIAITSAMIIVPVIVAIAMFSVYLRSKITISIQKKEILKYETEIGKLSGAVGTQKTLDEEKEIANHCISEVRTSVRRHTQWSPILAKIVEKMPYSVALTDLDIKQRIIKKRVPQKNNPEKMVEARILTRLLHMNVYGSASYDCDEDVRKFRSNLLSAPFLGPMLENITVSQKQVTVKGRDIATYEIDCIFKPKR